MGKECPQLDLALEWKAVRDLANAAYVFPPEKGVVVSQETYRKPAVYRWTIRKPKEKEPYRVYIGEADDFFSRLRDYVYAQSGQTQTSRVARLLREAAENGDVIELQVLFFPIFFVDGVMIEPPALSDPDKRKFMESYALIVQDRVNCEVLNLSMKRFERKSRKAEKAKGELVGAEPRIRY